MICKKINLRQTICSILQVSLLNLLNDFFLFSKNLAIFHIILIWKKC